MKLEITENRPDVTHAAITLSGVVNIHTARQLRQRLKSLLDDQHKEIRVNLEGVSFIDSAGIATLVEGLQWSRGSDRRFVLSGLSENVRDIFELAKLDTVFEIESGHVISDAD